MDQALGCLGHTWSTLVRLYTSTSRQGYKDTLLHFLLCLLFSLSLGSFLLLGLHLSLQYTVLVSGIISGTGVLLLTASLFLSRRARCYTLLFLVSCSFKQGRNVLLAAGTGLVFLWNVGNTFRNLHRVAQSVVCNLKQELHFLDLDLSPLKVYVDMIRRVSQMMENAVDFGLVKFHVTTRISSSVTSGGTKEKLREAAQTLNATAETAEAVYDKGLSVAHKLMPGVGVVVLAVATFILFKVYRQNKRYLNCYITPQFVRFDEQQRAEGKPHVLPLSRKEAKRYRVIPSARPTLSDWKISLKFLVPVAVQLVIWCALVGLDALLYWAIQTVNRHLAKLKPTSVPLKAFVNNNQATFSYSIEMFRKECLPQPTLLLSHSLVPLSIILVTLATMGLLAPKILHAKVLLIERFYGDALTERVQHLHAKILRKRSKSKLRALKSTLKSFGTNVSFWFPMFFSMIRNRDLPNANVP